MTELRTMRPRTRSAANAQLALSDEETSEVDVVVPVRRGHKSTSASGEDDGVDSKRKSVKTRPVNKDDAADEHEDEDEDEDEEDDDEDEEDGEEDENIFVVETIKKHMIDEDGTLKFHVKWEGYDNKNDMTWEPEENLKDSAVDVLNEYFESIGGRDKIFEETATASKTKKRGRPSTGTPVANTKRSKKNGTHPAESTPPATVKKWSPPAGTWEDEIATIDACEDEGSGKLVVYLVWKNGQKTKHDTQVIYKKCPQKMLQFYERHVKIIREDN